MGVDIVAAMAIPLICTAVGVVVYYLYFGIAGEFNGHVTLAGQFNIICAVLGHRGLL